MISKKNISKNSKWQEGFLARFSFSRIMEPKVSVAALSDAAADGKLLAPWPGFWLVGWMVYVHLLDPTKTERKSFFLGKNALGSWKRLQLPLPGERREFLSEVILDFDRTMTSAMKGTGRSWRKKGTSNIRLGCQNWRLFFVHKTHQARHPKRMLLVGLSLVRSVFGPLLLVGRY